MLKSSHSSLPTEPADDLIRKTYSSSPTDGVTMIDMENSTEMIELFKSVFQAETSETWWQWKYKEGGGKGFGYWENDSLLAHCGIFPRRIHSAGRSRLAWQLGDLMVRKTTRGRNLSRTSSPFARTVGTVLEHIPSTDNPERITFGFPSERAMRIGESLGLFATIDHWLEIELDHSLPNRSMLRINEVSLSDQRVQTQITSLWNTMSIGLTQNLVAERTAAYWLWRYSHHPTHMYRLVSVRRAWWPIPFAFVVLRETTPGRWLWVDFVGAVHQFSAAAQSAVMASKQFGGQNTFVFGSTMVSKAINTIVSTIRPTEIRIMANPASGTEFIERFKHRWWLMAGDTDYL